MAAIKQPLLVLFFVVNAALGIPFTSPLGPTFPGTVSGQGEITPSDDGIDSAASSETSALNIGLSGLPVGFKLPNFIPKPKPSELAQAGTVKLNNDMAKLNDTLSEMQATLKDLEDFNITEVVDTFLSLQKLRDHVTELETSITSIETSITSLSTDVASIKADNAMKSASVATNTDDVDNLKAEMSNLQTITSNMPDMEMIDDLRQQIADMNKRLDATDVAVADLSSQESCSSPACAEHQQASCSCVGAERCTNGSKHQCIEFECINYFNTPNLGLSVTEVHTETLPFDLRPGMKIVAELAGSQSGFNGIDIVHNGVYIFHLSIRWEYNKLVFNDKNNWWGSAVNSTPNPNSSWSRYKIDINVMDATFEVYMDGQYRLSGPIRHSLENSRTVKLNSISDIFRFEVHTNGACLYTQT